jgi:hypothetical protein
VAAAALAWLRLRSLHRTKARRIFGASAPSEADETNCKQRNVGPT